MESDVSSSPSKRHKTLTPKHSPSSSKGKEKMEEEEKEEEEEEEEEIKESDGKLCGICFEGNSIRGYIDSCDHFFCFVCIMEWSKVESRCPLCKQRFTNICRKPIGDVFPEERVVNVPVRNQVWHPLGNQTATEVADPYAEVKCIKCQTSSEDHLLLLCDLCDSAAHTFCVGLGYSVPEGDWYCEDCTKSRNEHSGNVVDTSFQQSSNFTTTTSNAISSITATETDFDSEDSSGSITIPDASRNVSISEIIRGSYSRRGKRSLRRTSRRQDSSRVRDRNISSECTVDSSARTLCKSRIAHNRVRVYRENWDAIRNASLGFSSSHPKSNGRDGRKRTREVTHDKSKKSQSSSSMNHIQSAAVCNASGDKMDCKGPYDTDRAWKMLDIAKSVQKAPEFTRSTQQGSSLHQDKGHVSIRLANSTSSSASMLIGKNLKANDLGGHVLKKDGGHRHVETAEQTPKSQIFEKGAPYKHAFGSSCKQGPPGAHPMQLSELALLKQAHVAGEFAKSVQLANECAQSRHLGEQDLLKAAHSGSRTVSTSRSKKFQPKDLGRNQSESNYRLHSLESSQHTHKFQNSQESKGVSGPLCCQRPSRIYPSQSCELPLKEATLKANEVDVCQKNDWCEKSDPQRSNGSSGNICSIFPTESLYRASDLSSDRSDLCASSCSMERRLKEVGTHRSCINIKVKKDEDAKCEVQSLVKLNLKLLGRDKRLGVNGFKEVARLATHTILAACGLEHKKASVRPFSDVICRHSGQSKQLHMSNLMPTSCRECFFGFVKDVVSSIMANEIAVP